MTDYKETLVHGVLKAIGEDPQREGLLATPGRVVRAWKEIYSGYSVSKEELDALFTSFQDGAESADELVLVSNIIIHSSCEHHMEPFFGRAHVGYLPNGRIVGLSKIARLVEVFSHRLQVQERLTSQIAQALYEGVNARAVGVVLECRHLCMERRGIKVAGTITTTSSMKGLMLEEPALKSEFLSLVQSARNQQPF